MGCRCCRMIKSYIYDPSVEDGRKSDHPGSSLYHTHHLSGDPLGGPNPDPLGGHNKQKQGFHNLGYSKSSTDGTLKFEADNNHFNRLHGSGGVGGHGPDRELPRQGGSPTPYIIQPETHPGGPRWPTHQDPRGPSQVPVYPSMQDYSSSTTITPSSLHHGDSRKSHYDNGDDDDRGSHGGWEDSPDIGGMRTRSNGSLSADEGVGGTPDPCDTGDEGDSVRSVDGVHTASTHSVSSLKTPDNGTMESGICDVMKGEEEEEEEGNTDAQSVTDSMVAEALAALEAATAGEECD